jgi:DNA-binding CsgD family transcriptional regulator
MFIFIIKKEWFVNTARTGAVLVIAGVSVFMASQEAYIQLFSTIVIGISLGCVNTSILMPFVFTLNNTEKFYAVVGSNILINLLLLFLEGNSGNYIQNNRSLFLSFALLLIALSATLFFKRNCISVDEKNNNKPKIQLRVYWTLFFSCAFVFLCKGAASGILNITVADFNGTLLTWYYLGGLIGCLIYFFLYAFTKKCIHLAWNITFGSVTMGLLCNAYAMQVPGLAVVFAVFLGIGNTIGMINVYYILGVIGEKYNSMKYLRWSILFIGICGGVSGVVVGNLINRINTFKISIAASVISAAVVIFFLILSPVLSKMYYKNERSEGLEKLKIDNEHLDIPDIFGKFKLTKRESQVCKLLLEGYTLRQISAVLTISYSTVNTYYTSIYRKLGINSRTELLILFKDYVMK